MRVNRIFKFFQSKRSKWGRTWQNLRALFDRGIRRIDASRFPRQLRRCNRLQGYIRIEG